LSQSCYKVSRSATLTVPFSPHNVRESSSITSRPRRVAAARLPVFSDPLSIMRVLDLVLLALALPVFLIAGLPVLGWVTGAAIWLMWRGIGAWADRRALAARDARVVAGYEGGGVIGRGWPPGLKPVA